MSIETGTVYMIDPSTGKQTPISHVSDAEITAEITCDAETTEMIRTFYDTREFNSLIYASIQIDDIWLSDLITILFKKPTNNYRRLHGGRAIRWRKFK